MKSPRRFLPSFLLLTLLLVGCGNGGNSNSNGNDADSILEPRGKIASRNDTTVISLLGEICGMNYGDAVKVDDYRERIQIDWEGISEVLSGVKAVFSEEKEGICSARASATDSRFPTFYMMVLDLENDVVSAAQFDGETAESKTWTEDENGKIPEAIDEWVREMESMPFTN